MQQKLKSMYLTTISILILIHFGVNGQNKFVLNKKTELITGAIGSTLFVASLLTEKSNSITINELNNLDQNQINALDRKATKFYSKNLSTLSDVLLITSISLPAIVLLTGEEANQDLTTIGLMYFETLLLTNGITNLTKNLTNRFRPYTYNPEVPISEKLDSDSRKSFFSGHTSVSFASAVFLSEVYSTYSDNKKLNKLVWAGSLTVATSVGLLRYFSGKHFPTDILTGAIVGGLIGYTIPQIHKKNSQVSLSQNSNQINFTLKFSSIKTRY